VEDITARLSALFHGRRYRHQKEEERSPIVVEDGYDDAVVGRGGKELDVVGCFFGGAAGSFWSCIINNYSSTTAAAAAEEKKREKQRSRTRTESNGQFERIGQKIGRGKYYRHK
jgi:hypothetical protein